MTYLALVLRALFGAFWLVAPFLALLGLVLGVRALINRLRHRPTQRCSRLCTVAIAVAFGLYLASAAAVFYVNEVGHRRTGADLSHLAYLGLAVHRYKADHRGALPDAATWCDELRPYLPKEASFVSTTEPKQRCAYAYNQALSGMQYDALDHPERIVLIFESDKGWNASGGPELLPSKPRHADGKDIYLFCDGHAAGCPRVESRALQWQPREGTHQPQTDAKSHK